MKNKIITLEDNTQYVVCEELYYFGELYVCCIPYNEERNDIDENQLIILKVIKDNEDIVLSNIDENVKEILKNMFLIKLSENI